MSSWPYRLLGALFVSFALSFRAAAQPRPEVPVEVTVKAESKLERVRESARAVSVIDLERDRRLTADLGTVLARNEGISVRRSGALGSEARLSLNGLTDEQVRVFVDGVPLELAGYPFGINNVPVELISRAEVHRGVVPLRLGTDALGGAVELVSDDSTRGTHGHISYQAGSFDTHRLLASARHYDPRTGLFARAEGFFDRSRNDYPIRVDQQGAMGLQRVTVRRNNDQYRAGSGSLEAGFLQRSWARKLLLRAFLADLDKGVPSNALMSVPYGRVNASRRATGAVLRYESVPLHGFKGSVIGGYNLRTVGLRDLSSCAYDWVGVCTVDRSPSRGEREFPADTRVEQRSGFGRFMLSRELVSGHELRLGVAPTFTRRVGEERALPAQDPDPLTGRRDLLTLASGIEYQADLIGERLQNLLFAKNYFMSAHSEELLPSGLFQTLAGKQQRFGGGDALRFRFSSVWLAKASYEYATRLPSPDQMYGDPTVLIDANLRLRPESSHNGNLSTQLDLRDTPAGSFRGELGFFTRNVHNLIYLFTTPIARVYNNVDRARSLGAEGNAGWTSPGAWVSLDANATYQDYRNRSESGQFASYEGGRIPNQPWLFANAVAQVFARKLMPERDELSLLWRSNYVHDFHVGWENANPGGFKERVPAQLVHSIGLTLLLHRDQTVITTTLEVHNLTDERVYDFLRVQLPGRSVAAKFTLGV